MKPNAGGSSFGVTKVKEARELTAAVHAAWEEWLAERREIYTAERAREEQRREEGRREEVRRLHQEIVRLRVGLCEHHIAPQPVPQRSKITVRRRFRSNW